MRRACHRFVFISTFSLLPFLSLAHEDPEYPHLPDVSVLGASNTLEPGFDPFPAEGVQLLSWLALGDFDAEITSGSNCWGYVSPAGREYALFGHSHGTSIVDITEPGDPVIVGQIDGPVSIWREIKSYDQYAYVVSEGGDGIQVIDLGEIDEGIVTSLGNVTDGGAPATHTVAVDAASGFIYRLGGAGLGLRAYDLADPANPVFAGEWNEHYVHDSQVVTYDSGPYEGMQIAFCCGGLAGGFVDPGLDILDVTDKDNIELLATLNYAGAAYSHQAWLSEDRQYVYLNDELDELSFGVECTTRIIDVSDIYNPVEAGTFTTGLPATDHNLYVVGNQILESNYRSGLRVFDATDPLAPVETAYFDTWHGDDDPGFNGLWGNYPFFPSGNVIGSDLEKGLFVWRIGAPPILFEFPGGVPDRLDPAGATVTVAATAVAPFALDVASVRFHYREGDAYTAVEMSETTPGTFEAVLPPFPCGEEVKFFVSALTTDGLIARAPEQAPYWHHHATAELEPDTLLVEDMESESGWTAGAPSDTATSGIWERAAPEGTSAQPSADHSAAGTFCWVTGQGEPGGALGANDVDGGATTLLSPLFDLSSGNAPGFGYWRWYSNSLGGGGNDDVFVVEISNDAGTTWYPVETIGPAGPDTEAGWFYREFRVSDYVAPSAEVQLRFIASDSNLGSIVEAAIDDLAVLDFECFRDCDNNGFEDALEIAADESLDCDGSGTIDACEIADGSSPDADGNGIPDPCDCPNPFIRGDVNGDGSLALADAIQLLAYLFASGTPPAVLESANVNGDGMVDISDPVRLLDYLFLAGEDPPPPFPEPGC